MHLNDESFARAWALDIHKDQTYGPHAYRYHIEQVVEKVKTLTDDPATICSAWLHDGPEDTDITLQDITDKVGQRISDIVRLVTDPEGYTNRKERKKALYGQFRGISLLINKHYHIEQMAVGASIVKCADRFCNQKESIDTNGFGTMKMYASEFPEFIRVFGSLIPDTLYFELHEQYRSMIEILDRHNNEKH